MALEKCNLNELKEGDEIFLKYPLRYGFGKISSYSFYKKAKIVRITPKKTKFVVKKCSSGVELEYLAKEASCFYAISEEAKAEDLKAERISSIDSMISSLSTIDVRSVQLTAGDIATIYDDICRAYEIVRSCKEKQ